MSASSDANAAAVAGNAVSSLIGIATSVKGTWDTSGGNELLGKMASSIPQGTKDYFGNASKNVFNRDHVRSVTVFFGVGEERPFYVEKSPSLLVARLRHNATFFYLNYMLLFAVLFMLTLIISPSAIIGIGLLFLAWIYVIRASQDGTLKIMGKSIPQQTATIGMTVISGCVLVYLLSHIFWWTIGSGGLLISVHAFTRDASMHQDHEDKVDMIGDVSLDENAAFLNQVKPGALQEV